MSALQAAKRGGLRRSAGLYASSVSIVSSVSTTDLDVVSRVSASVGGRASSGVLSVLPPELSELPTHSEVRGTALVLLVEDGEVARMVMSHMLRGADLNVLPAEDGLQARERTGSERG